MHFVVYAHSLVSDWNHGNAHFLRGVLSELQARGHTAAGREPACGWSRAHLVADQGQAAVDRFAFDFPELSSATYEGLAGHEETVAAADVVIVHEWTDPSLVAHLGTLRRTGRFKLLFHDTHHRGISEHAAIADLVLADYDAVLVFGETLRQHYERSGWGQRVFVWHEAADTRRFHPMPPDGPREDLVWIGNWGDGERARELDEFLIEPARELRLSGSVRGVRYPPSALARLAATRLRYGGWIANADVPRAFGSHVMTVHVPRRPYVQALPGIPTIRMFEALACGIPLVSAPWDDVEGLFRSDDYLSARDGNDMIRQMATLRDDAGLRDSIAAKGRETVLARHTCAHRVDELLTILDALA